MANDLTYTNYPYSDEAVASGDLGTRVQQDLTAAKNRVNALNGDNFASTSDVTCESVDVTTQLKVRRIRAKGTVNIVAALGSSFAGSKLQIKNSDGTVLFEVDSNKTVVVGS